jgi:hypothetical protein
MYIRSYDGLGPLIYSSRGLSNALDKATQISPKTVNNLRK